jgi:Bacterial SH3 domain
MTDSATLRSWLEPLGLLVKAETGASAEHLTVAHGGNADPRLEIRRSNPETWEVVHERRVSGSVREAAREVARGFPLVDAETKGDGGDSTVRFRAPVFDEGLTRQGFAMTVSAVLKAAQVFDLVLTRRAQEMADWREFEAGSEQPKQEQEQLINRMAEAGTAPDATEPAQPVAPVPRSDGTAPATAWSPTHVVRRRADAWAQPDPSGARAGTVQRRVPVQVLERRGEWAQVATSNGWSGWIDNRDLKER